MKHLSPTLFFAGLLSLAIGIAKSASIYQPLENLTGDRATNLPIQVAIALFVAAAAAQLIWGQRNA